MRIEKIDIIELKCYEGNARTHSQEQVLQIAESIKEFGFNNPVLVDENNILIAGHGRLEAAKILGLENVPAIVLSHLSDKQRRAYVLADNKIALNAGWDLEKLSTELKALAEEDYNLGVIGFADNELSALLNDAFETLPPGFDEPENIAKQKGKRDDDYVPAEQEILITKPGDIWILGEHRVMCGDSTSAEDVNKLTEGKQMDICVTDPPYNVAYTGKTKDALTIDNDSMSKENFYLFLFEVYKNICNAIKAGAPVYVFHADSEGANFRMAMRDAKIKLAQCLIWVKQTMVMGRQDYHWKHEPILYGWKEGAAHKWYTDRKQTTVLNFDRPQRNAEHPTMKPVEIIAYLIGNSSRINDFVLDLFGGGGQYADSVREAAKKGCIDGIGSGILRCYNTALAGIYGNGSGALINPQKV